MNFLHTTRMILSNPNRAFCFCVVLLANHVYKMATGYEASREFLIYYVAPKKLRPLERKGFPKVLVKPTTVSGVPIPDAWSPRLAKIDSDVLQLQCKAKNRRIDIWVTPCSKGLTKGTLIHEHIGRLARARGGNWTAFRRAFTNDQHMLEEILSVEMPKHLDSRVLPFFPHPTRHFHQTLLLTAKALITGGGSSWNLRGQNRFFYVVFGNTEKGCEVFVGSRKTGIVEAELVIGSKQKLRGRDLRMLLSVIDRGDFRLRLPVRARKPR